MNKKGPKKERGEHGKKTPPDLTGNKRGEINIRRIPWRHGRTRGEHGGARPAREKKRGKMRAAVTIR
jgi:hypothetical protein